MGRLWTIELENFKSYAGKQVVGPLKSFQAVIGPNGAGKSNLMDAISFVLGVKSRHLRSHKLGDLVFRTDGSHARRRASVKLVYRLDDGEIDGAEADSQIEFLRTIAATGVGSYRINNREVTWDQYDSQLKEIGVLTKARNFLVFQGDVESIASKSPKELTQLIEQISGSDEFRVEYDDYEKKKDEAEETQIFSYQKKRGYAAEKKQVKEQKDEAERFNLKVSELNEMKCEYYLWQLYHVDQEMHEHEELINKEQGYLEDIKVRETSTEADLKSAKKNQARQTRNYGSLEKTMAQNKSELTKFEPERVKLAAEVKNLEKKLKEDKRAAEKIEGDEREKLERIEGIQTDINNIQAKEREMDDATKTAREKSAFQMDETKSEEYENLKEQARMQTAADRSQLESLQRQQTADMNSLSQLGAESEDLQEKMKTDQARRLELDARLEKMTEAIDKTRSEYNAASASLREVQRKTQSDNEKRGELEEELEEVLLQLRDARDTKRQNMHEEKMTECLETLKRLFPGVHGRLVDLCKPVQRRYNKAVMVAAGRNMDAIVVDRQQTGYECIQYMREHRIGVASFIPLSGIKTKEVNERLRSLVNCRLCIDVINCSDEIKPAVMYAVENTIVCENLDDAREICFRRNENLKAVTLDGAVISKAGTMTGGNTPKDADRATRWDEQAHAELKSRKEELTAALQDLSRPARQLKTEQELSTNMGLLKTKEEYILKDQEVTKEKVRGLEKQRIELQGQLDRVRQDQARLGPIAQERAGEVEKLHGKIRGIEEAIFQKFSQSVGVASVQEFEDGQLTALREASEMRRKVREHKAKLEAQLQFERTRNFENPLGKIEKRLQQTESRLIKCREKQEAISKTEEGLSVKLHESEATLAAAKEELDEAEANVRALQAQRVDISKECAAIIRRITAEETSLEQLRSKLHGILQKAKVEEIDLPMLDASDGGNHSAEQRSGSVSQNSEVTVSTHFSQSDNQQMRQDQKDKDRVDFSKLENHRELRNEREFEKVKVHYESSISNLQGEIESMQPNMKAMERYEDVSERHKTSNEEWEQAKVDARDATATFNKIKQRRHDAFMSCFQHISEELQTIYRDLTKSSKHPLGGHAYLSLDDTEDPFLGGIKYNAMPPMKRFRDMDQLSGGEKTVAALALLFAIHSFRPAPFFVMDEVDAALDNVNVKKVCNYIKQRSRDFQCIVISLKDMFYEQADSLVGICRDVSSNSSRTLSLNLRQFDGEGPDDE